MRILLPPRRKVAKFGIIVIRPKGETFVRSLAFARDYGHCSSPLRLRAFAEDLPFLSLIYAALVRARDLMKKLLFALIAA